MEEKFTQLVAVKNEFYGVTLNPEDQQEEYLKILFLGLLKDGEIEYLSFDEEMGLSRVDEFDNFARFHNGPPPKGAAVY